MPHGTSALSRHILFSEFRGPRILNDASATPPEPAPPATPPEPPAPPAKPDVNEEFKTRLTDLETKNKEYKTKLKEYEDAEKKRQEDEAKAKGEHEKLANQYASERDTEKTARETAEAKLKVYEEHAQGQIKQSLEGITDAEKRKSAEAMLAGLSTEEQIKRLPDILKLVGQTSPGFGAQTPASQVDQASKDQKKARYNELLGKPNKTPKETQEMHALMPEVTKMWEEEQAKKNAA